MAAQRGNIASGNDVAWCELIFQGEVIALNVRCLVMKLDAAQCQSRCVDINRIQGHARQTVFDGCNGTVRKETRGYGVGGREIESVLERIVIPEAWIAASVFKRSKE